MKPESKSRDMVGNLGLEGAVDIPRYNGGEDGISGGVFESLPILLCSGDVMADSGGFESPSEGGYGDSYSVSFAKNDSRRNPLRGAGRSGLLVMLVGSAVGVGALGGPSKEFAAFVVGRSAVG